MSNSRAWMVLQVRAVGFGFRAGWVRMAALSLALGVGPALAEDIAVPQQPTEPVPAKAFGVFDQACAGCHQIGKLKNGRQPSGALGNILDLAALARNPALVTPGNADASPLYTSMQSRAMPTELPGDAAATELTATELAAVRDWIERLPVVTGCGERVRMSGAMIAKTVGSAVQALDAVRAAKARFISLAPLYNSCATDSELVGARQAVALVINALSPALEPAPLTSLGPDGVVLQVDLGAIGWTATAWDKLAQRAPAASFTPFDDAVRAATGTSVPMVNGDWLADAATRAPLYYELLGVPDTLPALLANLKLDLANQKKGAADRIGIRTSQVARGNRLLERRAFANGAAWLSYEFAPTAGRPDMFDMTVAANAAAGGATGSPAGGAAGATVRTQPNVSPDATLLHFDLPNGFPAFFAANPSGARINDLPLSMLKDDAHPAAKVAAAQSCLGCHGAAPVALARGRADDLKQRLTTEPALSKEARERLLTLHAEPVELQRRIDEDRGRFARAAAAAGIEPERLVDGVALLPALIARYRRDVTAAELAGLIDVEPKSVFELGRTGSSALVDVTERLAFGPVSRTEIDAVMPELALKRGVRLAAPATTGVTAPLSGDTGTTLMRLVLKAARPAFELGDLLTFSARATASCYLTVLTVDARGRGTVLYPNEFEPNNFIEAGRDVRVPGDKAPYQFRLRDKGEETLIGICATTAKSVDGIQHDFEKQRFTELGDYRAFLNRNWGRDGDAKARTKASRKPGETAAPETPAKPDVQARTAVRIRIE